MIKLTVLYGHPTDIAAFEEYYANTHLPLAATMKGFEKVEYTKFISATDGSQAAYYRMAEFWFTSPEALQATMGSAEGQAAAADLGNFATGGVKLLVGAV
ncbi:ethyl tert-butyl ether degradation protein EthD [Chitinophagaceae bacterium IBVUCB2]|nr:ethyl tert-butyl ether degradation protein EthD [Chitinophagaceae bacterium IBVUCB2]